MRRTITVLGSTLLLATLVLTLAPAAWAATVSVGNSGAPGDCSGNFTYEPASASIQPGDSVTFTNPQVHNNGCAAADHPTQCRGNVSKGECPFQTEDLDVGDSFTVTFPKEGTFRYRCIAHPYMEGTVVVGDGDPSQPPPPPPSPSPDPSSPPPPSPQPSPTATAQPSPTATPAPDASTPTDEPSPDTTSEPDSATTDEPTDDTTTEPSDEPTDDETDEPTTAATGTDAEPTDDEDDDAGSGGGGVKAIATILLLATGGAVWSVRRGG